MRNSNGTYWLCVGQFNRAKSGSPTRQTPRLRQNLSGKAQRGIWQTTRLDACLKYVREGDTLVVTRLDRLARSTFHLAQIADELQRKQVHLHVIDQNIDTSHATGRLLFNMLGAIAQFETELRAERQMDGIQKAKERGVRFGATQKLTDVQIAELRQRREQGVLIKALMADYRISKATVYRYLEEMEEEE
jgi:DNA invertase Pin-like site-specific DNA recombinase